MRGRLHSHASQPSRSRAACQKAVHTTRVMPACWALLCAAAQMQKQRSARLVKPRHALLHMQVTTERNATASKGEADWMGKTVSDALHACMPSVHARIVWPRRPPPLLLDTHAHGLCA